VVKPMEASIKINLIQDMRSIEYISKGVQREVPGGTLALEDIIEIKLPLSEIGLGMNQKFYYFLKLTSDDEELERLPRQGAIKTITPSAKKKSKRWYH